MPTSSKNHPPKNCPVCGETVWVKWGTSNHDWVWYRNHLKSSHPVYEKWHAWIVAAYFAALIPFIGLFVLATTTPIVGGNYLAILPFPSFLLEVILVWLAQRRGTRRFRNLWKMTNNPPFKPP